MFYNYLLAYGDVLLCCLLLWFYEFLFVTLGYKHWGMTPPLTSMRIGLRNMMV